MLQQSTDFGAKVKKIYRQAEERETQRNAKVQGVNYLDSSEAPISVEALKDIPEATAQSLNIGAFQIKGRSLLIAALDPTDPKVKEFAATITHLKPELFMVSRSSLDHIISYYKFIPKNLGPITGKIKIEQDRLEELLNELTDLEAVNKNILSFDINKFSLGQLLEVVLAGALKNKASDIHMEAEAKSARLRYRLDGLLYDVSHIENKVYEYLVNRIKLLSELKINIHDAPQDGRFTTGLKNKDIEFRVSVIPSEYGETIVMRVLDPDNINLRLEDLGLKPSDLEIIKEQLKEPNGIIFNTGPTGSGKTTTLYTFLQYLRSPEMKIITVEDPIEYRVEGIEQTQTKPEAEYDFANALRSIMRQEPDVILVGEVRDKETAEMAIQAALTGHLVLSTIHANSAAAALPRLLDLGVKTISIAPALNLVIAQRLVRKLCQTCKGASKVSSELKEKVEKFLARMPERIQKEEYKDYKIYLPHGCNDCHNLGYRGRVAVFELLVINDDYEELITRGAGEVEIFKKAVSDGMTTLQEDAILKVLKGITSLEEVESVTGPLKW